VARQERKKMTGFYGSVRFWFRKESDYKGFWDWYETVFKSYPKELNVQIGTFEKEAAQLKDNNIGALQTIPNKQSKT
jgi:hypothetical protein